MLTMSSARSCVQSVYSVTMTLLQTDAPLWETQVSGNDGNVCRPDRIPGKLSPVGKAPGA
jgi:hypothetical protein